MYGESSRKSPQILAWGPRKVSPIAWSLLFIFYFLRSPFSILLPRSPHTILCWHQQWSIMDWQEPDTLEEEKLLFHWEELWSMRVGKPLLLCSLCCLGSTQALRESALQGEVNKAPAFWPEDWKRGTSVNWKVQERSQRGRREKHPWKFFMKSWARPQAVHALTPNSI